MSDPSDPSGPAAATGSDPAAPTEPPERFESWAPLDDLGALAALETQVTDRLRHVEIYTLEGLLTLLWHGDPSAESVLLACGGAMGGLLGPAGGIYHDLGERLAERGIGTIRVGYRRPNRLTQCAHDLLAAADLAGRSGGRRFLTMGHSFGGAVAVQAGIALGDHCRGVVTLATQSAGCEQADELRAPLLLFHGDRDELLPAEASFAVRTIAGQGELVPLPGAGHLLTEAAGALRERLLDWIPARLRA